MVREYCGCDHGWSPHTHITHEHYNTFHIQIGAHPHTIKYIWKDICVPSYIEGHGNLNKEGAFH